VIFVTSEDDPHKATRLRLRVAGADLSRIGVLRTVVEDGGERQVCLQRDLAAIEHAIVTVGDVALVVIDPVDSYIGRADSNANEEMRRVLEPLVRLAEAHGVCFLVVKHLNKAVGNPSALYRIAGTMAFVALPRTVHIVGVDPEDKRRKLFVPVKVSHGIRPDALAYEVKPTDDGHPVIAWEPGTVDADADDLLSHKPAKSATALERAVTWLRDILEREGSQPSKELDERAEACGIAKRTLDRAKERLGVTAEQVRERGKLSGWTVSLPKGGSS
jgi:RecA-family ATPase